MSDRGLDFLEGSSFANAMNSIAEASIEQQRQKLLDDVVAGYKQQVSTLCDSVHKANGTIARLDSIIDADRGIIAVMDEEVVAAEEGTLPEKRLSGSKTNREGVRKELQRLSAIDRDLAMEGGRFSRSAKDHLRRRLRSRIEEFVEYGVEHQMSFLSAGQLKPEHVKEMWDSAEKQAKGFPVPCIEGELLVLQRAMNMLYIEATPKQDEAPFQPVNLIVAMGMTVKQLADKAGIAVPTCQYSNPPCDFQADAANDALVRATP